MQKNFNIVKRWGFKGQPIEPYQIRWHTWKEGVLDDSGKGLESWLNLGEKEMRKNKSLVYKVNKLGRRRRLEEDLLKYSFYRREKVDISMSNFVDRNTNGLRSWSTYSM